MFDDFTPSPRASFLLLALVAGAGRAGGVDGGTCLSPGDPQVTRLQADVEARNAAARAKAQADAGLVLVPMEAEPSECITSREAGRPGTLVLGAHRARFILGFAESEDEQKQPTAIAKDHDGLYHLVHLETATTATTSALRVCGPCPEPRCWTRGAAPCVRQPRFGPLALGARAGPLVVLRWTEERLEFDTVTPKCGPMPACPAIP